jgi:hypothetical protein
MVDMNDRDVQNTTKKHKNEEGPNPLEILISEIEIQKVLFRSDNKLNTRSSTETGGSKMYRTVIRRQPNDKKVTGKWHSYIISVFD